jgi:DNA-binding transcriptional regulator LsrR (DeoR family)
MSNKIDLFNLLRKITFEPKLSQREMAKELGFSLGKLNYCLKALNQKSLIKINNFKQNKDRLTHLRKYVLIKKG